MRTTRLWWLILTISLLVTPAASSVAGAGSAPSRAVLATIHFSSPQELAFLTSRLDVWEVHNPQGWLKAYLAPAELQSIRQAGFQVEVDQAGTQTLATPRQAAPNQLNGIPGFSCYRTVEETSARLAELVSQYPGLASTQVIGASWDKVTLGGPAGYDLQTITLTNSAIPGPKAKFFLMAEIHAREYATAETALRFAEYLLQNYGVDPDITWLLDYQEVVILPMSNPDGRKKAEDGLYWRKNTNNTDGCLDPTAYGVDLNRNSSAEWGTVGASPIACEDTYSGKSAASEPETQAIQTFVTGLFPGGAPPTPTVPAPSGFQGLFITLHSFQGLVLWPFGSTYALPPNHTGLQTLGRKLAFFNGYYPEQAAYLYPTSGTTDDWAYSSLGVPAYTFEMGSAFFEDCQSFESLVWPVNRDALKYAFKASRLPYQLPAGPEITTPGLQPVSVFPGGTLTLTATANDTRFNARAGVEPSQPIEAARYSIDTPSWISGALLQPLTAADGVFNSPTETLTATLDTTGLTVGRHIIYIEALDAAGSWGVPSAIFLTILNPFSVKAAPPASSAAALAGQAGVFHLTVTNKGTIADSYTLSAASLPAWDTQLSEDALGPLAPGASAQLEVTVTVPPGALPGSFAVTHFLVKSLGSPGVTSSADLETRVLWPFFIPFTHQ